MASLIKRVVIRNFRSLESTAVECGDITAFVGQNDAGKSNVLRALNLFFNNKTDHGVAFDFDRDFNAFASVGTNKAKEISIELTIDLPPSYKKVGFPPDITWKKVWRRHGLHRDGESRFYTSKEDFPPYSKVPALLDRITYNYVPAIKDKDFFSDLQGQVYDVLSDVAADSLRSSAQSFEGQIQKHVKDLMESVTSVVGVSSMRMPKNLRQVFENLEFDAEGIPLSLRGDGIKIRHIPMILRFIAEKRNSIRKMGVTPHIWGFEEPENNVELRACFEMAAQFEDASKDGFQIMLTTHSPVFYGMEVSESTSFRAVYVKKVGKLSDVSPIHDRTVVDHELGLMPLVTPFVLRERKGWQDKNEQLTAEFEKLKKAAERRVPHIFVEGDTDARVVNKALELFGVTREALRVVGGGAEFGSASAAANRAVAWQLVQQHEREPVRAAVLLDADSAGKSAAVVFNQSLSRTAAKHVKSFFYGRTAFGVELRKAGVRLPDDLEMTYPSEIWEHAESKGWLQERDHDEFRDMFSAELFKSVVAGGIGAVSGLSESARLRINKKFSDDGKESAAKYIARMSDLDATYALAHLLQALVPILSYVGIDLDKVAQKSAAG